MSPFVEPRSRLKLTTDNRLRRIGWGVAVAAFGLVGGWVSGQEPTPVPPPQTKAESKFENKCDRFRLDKDKFDFGKVEDDSPVRGEDELGGHEYRTYNDILLRIREFPVNELEECARKGLAFRDLVKDVRRDYQFELVYFKGRLKRLREAKPNRPLAEGGVKALYECWVFPDDAADPMCVVTTELPEGLTPAKEYSPGKPVAFAGYSFKLMQYESSQPNPKDPSQFVRRRAPLILAKTLTLLPGPEPYDDKKWRDGFIPGILALLGVVVAVILGLTWWFGRGAKNLQREINERYEKQNPFAAGAEAPTSPAPDGGPPAPGA